MISFSSYRIPRHRDTTISLSQPNIPTTPPPAQDNPSNSLSFSYALPSLPLLSESDVLLDVSTYAILDRGLGLLPSCDQHEELPPFSGLSSLWCVPCLNLAVCLSGDRPPEQVVEALQLCHEENPWSKFWGACNDAKTDLDRCFRVSPYDDAASESPC